MKVCAMGGAGRMALCAVRELVEADDVEALVLADADEAAVNARVAELGATKVSAATVEVTDRPAMVAVLADVLVLTSRAGLRDRGR